MVFLFCFIVSLTFGGRFAYNRDPLSWNTRSKPGWFYLQKQIWSQSFLHSPCHHPHPNMHPHPGIIKASLTSSPSTLGSLPWFSTRRTKAIFFLSSKNEHVTLILRPKYSFKFLDCLSPISPKSSQVLIWLTRLSMVCSMSASLNQFYALLLHHLLLKWLTFGGKNASCSLLTLDNRSTCSLCLGFFIPSGPPPQLHLPSNFLGLFSSPVKGLYLREEIFPDFADPSGTSVAQSSYRVLYFHRPYHCQWCAFSFVITFTRQKLHKNWNYVIPLTHFIPRRG